jgi:hypothetical protein
MGDVEDPDFDIEEVLKKGKERTEELTQKLKSMAGYAGCLYCARRVETVYIP